MADTYTKIADLIDPEVMGDMVSARIPKKLRVAPFAKVDDTLAGVPGDTITVPAYAYIGDAEPQEDYGERYDGKHRLLMSGFYNVHSHAPMTLLRGYADDMELFTWLNDYIWPAEAKLTEEDVYCGTRLAILEMIRSGTVFFSDMYWHQRGAVRAAEEMGVRAAIGLLYLSGSDGEVLERNRRSNEELLLTMND